MSLYTFTYGPSNPSPSLQGSNAVALIEILRHIDQRGSTTTALNLPGVGELCAALNYTAAEMVEALDAICHRDDCRRARTAAQRSFREWSYLASSASVRNLFSNGISGPSTGPRVLEHRGLRLLPTRPCYVNEYVVGDYAVRTISQTPIARLQILAPEGSEQLVMHLTQEGLVYVTYGMRVVWCGAATSAGPTENNPMTFDRRFTPPPADVDRLVRSAIFNVFDNYAAIRALRSYADSNEGRGYLCGRPLPTALALRAGIRAADFRSTFAGCYPDGFAAVARTFPRSARVAPSVRRRWSWAAIPADVARIMEADLTLSLDEPEAR